jgi:hypothetical protein
VMFPLSLAHCGITLARQDRMHNVNLAEVDGGYALGMENLCSLNIRSKFMLGDPKKGLASPPRAGGESGPRWSSATLRK